MKRVTQTMLAAASAAILSLSVSPSYPQTATPQDLPGAQGVPSGTPPSGAPPSGFPAGGITAGASPGGNPFVPQPQRGPAFGEGVQSSARGKPLPDVDAELVGAGGPEGGWTGIQFQGAGLVSSEGATMVASALPGETPEGVEPLERDLFTSDDFYADRDLWMDQRYWRCNSGLGLAAMLGDYVGVPAAIEGDDISKAPWGYCNRDYPREAIVSPYEFKTAQEHYEALMAEAVERGGPTQHTAETLPNWNGRYMRARDSALPQWYFAQFNQVPTMLSLLTEQYQTYYVQQLYHTVVNRAAQWPASYCWPEGLMRFWSAPAVQQVDLIMTPEQVNWLGGWTGSFVRQAQIGREFILDANVPRLGPDVARWYGETVGFWDEDALITWTSNVQGWYSHDTIEYSNDLQVIEIYTPRYEGDEFLGLHHEAIFYDSKAFAEPLRLVRTLNRTSALNEGDPWPFIDCVQTIYPQGGRASPVSPGAEITIEATDWYGRPWAQQWEKYFEQGMDRPKSTEGLFGF